MSKFILIGNVDTVQQVKKNKYVDCYVSEKLAPIEILEECQKYKKKAFVFDPTCNIDRLNVQKFPLFYSSYKHYPSFLGNVLGFHLRSANFSMLKTMRSILGTLDSSKLVYCRFHEDYLHLEHQICVANRGGSCFEVQSLRNIASGLRFGASGFEFSPHCNFNIKRVIRFLRMVESFHFHRHQISDSEVSILGEVDFTCHKEGILLIGKKQDNIHVYFKTRKKFLLHTIKGSHLHTTKHLKLKLAEEHPAVISYL